MKEYQQKCEEYKLELQASFKICKYLLKQTTDLKMKILYQNENEAKIKFLLNEVNCFRISESKLK